MILQALVKYYDNALSKAVTSGWQQRKASYIIDIDKDGNILASSTIAQIHELMPEAPKGKTGLSVKAAFLCDTGAYMFGIEEVDDKIKNGQEKYSAIRTLHLDILKNAQGEIATAIKAFFASEQPKQPPEGIKKGTVCILAVNGIKAYENDEIIRAWNAAQLAAVSGTVIVDMVTGDKDVIARLHGNIKGLGQDSPSLINVNKQAFASYGKSENDPAAYIGEQTAFKYVTALNFLIADAKHRSRVGGSSFIYWAEGGQGDEEAIFSSIWDMKIEEDSSSKLKGIISAIKDGKPINNCNIDCVFHILCLSLQSKRIVVRHYYNNTFGNFINNIINHYEGLEIIDDDLSRLTPFHLLGNTTVKKGEKYGEPSPLLGGQLLNAIITGRPYPMTLYNAILTRIRAGEDINKAKASIVKAILIRNYYEQEVTTVTLNAQTSNKPYILGRLFSVLEKLQKEASGGKLNATIRDKYFAAACANPASVFPTVLKLSMHHAAKLDNAVFYEKLKTALLGKLDAETPFPKALGLDDQGRFILGYYHQTQDLYTKKENKTTEEEANV